MRNRVRGTRGGSNVTLFYNGNAGLVRPLPRYRGLDPRLIPANSSVSRARHRSGLSTRHDGQTGRRRTRSAPVWMRTIYHRLFCSSANTSFKPGVASRARFITRTKIAATLPFCSFPKRNIGRRFPSHRIGPMRYRNGRVHDRGRHWESRGKTVGLNLLDPRRKRRGSGRRGLVRSPSKTCDVITGNRRCRVFERDMSEHSTRRDNLPDSNRSTFWVKSLTRPQHRL